MARRRKGEIINGWIVVNKPDGMTSTQVVEAVKRLLHPQKAGHAGTLDPMATGILPVALGEATKTVQYVQDQQKAYRFRVRWGETRSTDDREGEVTATSPVRPSPEDIKAILPRFQGEIEQIPPKFSAIKIDGQRAYDLARAGEEIEMPVRTVRIDSIRLLGHAADWAEIEVTCGKGTYMRALARDIAQELGTLGYIDMLQRLRVGSFALEKSISLDQLEKMVHSSAPQSDYLRPVETALDDIPALALTASEANRLTHGQSVALISRQDRERLQKAGIDTLSYAGAVLVRTAEKPIAIAEINGTEIRPVRVLNL